MYKFAFIHSHIHIFTAECFTWYFQSVIFREICWRRSKWCFVIIYQFIIPQMLWVLKCYNSLVKNICFTSKATSVYEHFSPFSCLAGEVDKNRNLNLLMLWNAQARSRWTIKEQGWWWWVRGSVKGRQLRTGGRGVSQMCMPVMKKKNFTCIIWKCFLSNNNIWI